VKADDVRPRRFGMRFGRRRAVRERDHDGTLVTRARARPPALLRSIGEVVPELGRDEEKPSYES
jgi:hypothetical protein